MPFDSQESHKKEGIAKADSYVARDASQTIPCDLKHRHPPTSGWRFPLYILQRGTFTVPRNLWMSFETERRSTALHYRHHCYTDGLVPARYIATHQHITATVYSTYSIYTRHIISIYTSDTCAKLCLYWKIHLQGKHLRFFSKTRCDTNIFRASPKYGCIIHIHDIEIVFVSVHIYIHSSNA